jgi:hypothetical protein
MADYLPDHLNKVSASYGPEAGTLTYEEALNAIIVEANRYLTKHSGCQVQAVLHAPTGPFSGTISVIILHPGTGPRRS